MSCNILKQEVEGLKNNKGFISIISLLVMWIIIISSLFLIHVSNLDYLILNSSKNSMQSYYLGESKILKVLYQDYYYHEELLPRIRTYLKYGYLGKNYSYKIRLDKKDLAKGDKHQDIDISFSIEDSRRLLILNTKSFFNNITKEIQAKVNIIKDFYEMGIPILSKDSIDEDKISEYLGHMDYLQEKIKISPLDNDIMGVEAIDYDNVFICKDLNGRKYIEFYRNFIDHPIMHQYLNNDKLFLIARESTNLFIGAESNMDKITLRGIIYIDGDVEISNDLEFYGILIINQGHIYVSPNSELKVEGVILSRDYPFITIENENGIEINYNEYEIKTNGIYLPGFIEPKIKVIKGG